MTVFLPRVSAKKPQRCDETTIPTNPIALKTPLSRVVKFMSHCATGKMKLIPTVSRTTQPSIEPHKITRTMLNFPNPVRANASSSVNSVSLFSILFMVMVVLTHLISPTTSLQLKRKFFLRYYLKIASLIRLTSFCAQESLQYESSSLASAFSQTESHAKTKILSCFVKNF